MTTLLIILAIMYYMFACGFIYYYAREANIIIKVINILLCAVIFPVFFGYLIAHKI